MISEEVESQNKGKSTLDILHSPVAFLTNMLGELSQETELKAYEHWWEVEGKAISETIDRNGTPWLRMFDVLGKRVDEIAYPAEYWKMLYRGYQDGVIWRVFEQDSLLPSYLIGYVTSFYDPGLYCPYTVSLSTAVPLHKYGSQAVKDRFLPQLLRKDKTVWQGATWMTEVKGGSDLGAGVETIARQYGEKWLLSGEKYFASNAHAELAIVAARIEGAAQSVRGLALFLAPKYREDGSLNFTIRRIKDKIGTRSVPTGEVELIESEAYLLGQAEWGIYLILEALNLSRIANSVGSVALAQRALSDALRYAEGRTAFGKQIIEHPLLNKQFTERMAQLKSCFRLAWEATRLLDEVWREKPRYSERYNLFRLLAHLAKYWTAEFAVLSAKWTIEVYAGVGSLVEYGVERWLREAIILQIWEGTPHRQMLDGLEVLDRKHGHELLFRHLEGKASPQELEEMMARVDAHLALPVHEREAQLEALFGELVNFTMQALDSTDKQ